MKRIISLILVILTLAVLTACGKVDSNQGSNNSQSDYSDDAVYEQMDPDVTEDNPEQNAAVLESNRPLTLTRDPSKGMGKKKAEEYSIIQEWEIVYFDGGLFSRSDVYMLFATKEAAAYYADVFDEELCDNGYFVKYSGDQGWEYLRRQQIIDKIEEYGWMQALSMYTKIEDEAINPCDRFDEIKKEFNLP